MGFRAGRQSAKGWSSTRLRGFDEYAPWRVIISIRDGDIFIRDAEGLELPDNAEAQIEAAEFLGDMVKDIATREATPAGYPMSVEVRRADMVVLILGYTFPGAA